MPPKSEIPNAEEESPIPSFEMTEAEGPAETTERAKPAVPEGRPAEDGREPPPAVLPAPEEPAPKQNDNLFDEAAVRRRSQARLMMIQHAALQQERLRAEAARQQSARVLKPAASGGDVAAPGRHSEPKVVGEPRRMPSLPVARASHLEHPPAKVGKAQPSNPLR